MAEQSYVEINEQQFKVFVKLPSNTPVVMLNLLKFKDAVVETGLSGEESYKAYMKAASPFFMKT